MKESAYNLSIRDEKEHYCLFNTRSGVACLMDGGEYRSYWAAATGKSSLEDVAATIRRLVEGGFLIDDETDELALIEAGHIRARTSRESLDLVIAPSMACNLDCPYCFETNRYAGRMSEETQDRVVALVRNHFEKGTRRLAVTWYGGEPLLALAAIGRLSRQFLALCGDFRCAYSAMIVTNGTLLTPDKARQLKSWSVTRAQVTLDGVPELHDTLRVPRKGTPTFHRILDGIEAAARFMHVSIRINVSRESAAQLDELLQILAGRGLNAKASVYLAPLRGLPALSPARAPALREQREPRRSRNSDGQIGLLSDDATAEIMLRFDDLLRKYRFPTHPNVLPQPRSKACIADHDHGWMIETNGDVHKCYWAAGLRGEAVGHLAASGIEVCGPNRKWQDWNVFAHATCAACVMLPLCLGRCPLRQMNGDDNICPPFLHVWDRILARAAALDPDHVAPVQLPLAGPRIRDMAARDVARPTTE